MCQFFLERVGHVFLGIPPRKPAAGVQIDSIFENGKLRQRLNPPKPKFAKVVHCNTVAEAESAVTGGLSYFLLSTSHVPSI
jgi:hypothetical protein